MWKHIKKGWHQIGDKKIYFRSDWEVRFARYLEWLKDHNLIIDWFYEPVTFWFDNIKRGIRSYKPDFKVIQTAKDQYFVEVKGYFDRKSMTKIKRFRKYFPDKKLILVDKEWFKNHNL